MNETSQTNRFYDHLGDLAMESRWDEFQRLVEEVLEEAPDHSILRANRCICRYHLGEAEKVIPEITYLLGDWPHDYPQLSLIALGILCTDRAGDLESRRNFAFQLAQETAIRTLLAWDMPTVPWATDGASVFEANSPGPLTGILEEVRNESGWDEVQCIFLDTLIAHYKERQQGADEFLQQKDDDDDSESVVDDESERRLIQVLDAFAEA